MRQLFSLYFGQVSITIQVMSSRTKKMRYECILSILHRFFGQVGVFNSFKGLYPTTAVIVGVVDMSMSAQNGFMLVLITPPETNSKSPWKLAILKGNEKVFQPSIFRGVNVSFREGKIGSHFSQLVAGDN